MATVLAETTFIDRVTVSRWPNFMSSSTRVARALDPFGLADPVEPREAVR